MATSEMSKSNGCLGVAPTTYVCPKLAGSVASGVVLLGLFVLILIPRTDNSLPIIAETSLPPSPVPEVSAPTLPAPSIDRTVPEPAQTDVEQPAEPDVEPENPSTTVATAMVPDQPTPTPDAAEVEDATDSPNVHPNSLRILEGRCYSVSSGYRLLLRDAEEKSFAVHLAGVFAPDKGSGKVAAGSHLRRMALRKQIRVDCVVELEENKFIGWVTVAGESVNEMMIARGLAWYDYRTTPSAKLEQLQNQARAAGKGIWRNGDVKPPFEAASQQPANEEHAKGSASNTAGRPAESTQAGGEKTPNPAPSEPLGNDTPENEPKKVVVDQSTPENLVTSFIEALGANDLDTARGLIGGRPLGSARSFGEGKLSESAIGNLRETFSRASIRGTRGRPRNMVAVITKIASGGDARIDTRQSGENWVIVSWHLPR